MLWLAALVMAALSVVTRAAEPAVTPVQTEPLGSRVAGIVHRPDGKPAAGATVQIIGGHPESQKQHQIDAEGRFAIQCHPNPFGGNGTTSRLLIRDPERNLATACELEEGSGPLDLRLEPGLTLVGRAECGGKPLTNATASLLFWTGDKGETLTGLCVGTNTPGRFEIPALPPGRRYGVYVSAPGYGQQYTVSSEVAAADGRVELDPVEFNPANFKPAIFKIAGQVVSADGQPVTNANVILQGDSQSNGEVRTDSEGRFRFEHVCEGPVRLFANANAYGNISAEAGDTNVLIKLGKNLTDNTEVVTHQLKGIVTDPNGQPVSGAQVAAGDDSGVPHWVETDTNGTYSLTWSYLQQSGSAALFARHVARNLVVLADLSEETTNFNVQLEPGLIFAGRVESNNGKPIAGAEVGIGLAVSTTTGTDGRFEMKALPALPQYGFLAKARGYSSSLQLAQAGLDTNRIELEPFILKAADQVLSGQVLDQNGKPVSDVTVSFPGEDGLPVKAITDRRGRFSFKVCEGTFRLIARGLIGYADASAEAGDTNVIIQLGDYGSSAGVAPRRPTLQGKPLPDLTALGLAASVPAGKPMLLCLVDVEQRPSRRVARLLVEQHAALQQQGVTVLAVQAAAASAEAVKEWQGASPVPFPVGRVADASAKTTKWATTVESLPWLILTDKAGRVVAEGFALDDLGDNLKKVLK
jgi:protocatechuate 3,4-dioxygenase beta subunit